MMDQSGEGLEMLALSYNRCLPACGHEHDIISFWYGAGYGVDLPRYKMTAGLIPKEDQRVMSCAPFFERRECPQATGAPLGGAILSSVFCKW